MFYCKQLLDFKRLWLGKLNLEGTLSVKWPFKGSSIPYIAGKRLIYYFQALSSISQVPLCLLNSPIMYFTRILVSLQFCTLSPTLKIKEMSKMSSISSKLDGPIELKLFSKLFENLSSSVFKVSCYKLPSFTPNKWFIQYDPRATRFWNTESQSHDSNLEFQNSRIPYHVTVSHMMTYHLAKQLWEL